MLRCLLCPVALVIFAFASAPALAEGTAAPPPVNLEQLLKLPSSLDLEPTARGSATKAKWRTRFDTARSELASARAALVKSQAKLVEVAGDVSAWKMSAPGIGVEPGAGSDSPLDFGLSQEMRRNREEVARSERRMTELEIEANLAGVPEDWRGTPVADEAAAPQAPAGPPSSTE